MKLVIDEKLKHRLVGLSVILSLGAIFLPAMMKKSSQRLENNFSVNVQLPPKPVAPNVAVTDEEAMFKTIKVSKIDISAAAAKDQKDEALAKEDYIQSIQATQDAAVKVAKADPAPDADAIEKPLELALSNAAQNAVKKQVKVAVNKPVRPVIKAAKAQAGKRPVVARVNKNTAVKKDIYAVQLASFAKQANAQALVNKLRSKGYKANFTKIASRQGVIYKVYTGHSPVKNDVVRLRTQLASAMQLNGFVVNTGVS